MDVARFTLVALLAYAVLACIGYLRNIGRPRGHPDHEVARFLAAQGWSDLATNAVLFLVAVGALRGRSMLVAWLFGTALAVQGAVYTWRWWLSRRMPRSRKSGITNKRGKGEGMRFKIDPEVIRLVVMITAGVQAMTAVLTGTDALPDVALVWVVALGAFLQGVSAAYAQGQQTEPPHGMITEDYARADVGRAEMVTASGREPDPSWRPDTRPEASG